ncbi:MAG: EF-hand domain-containing protein [Gammaproteobacteria bacterium]|nr:EF-hand domain-containing protein [Gammaproteobacteria bacterium]
MKNILFAVTLIVSAVAFADNNGRFADVDADQNGLVSLEEAQSIASLSQDFAALDVDADGQLSSDEFQQF